MDLWHYILLICTFVQSYEYKYKKNPLPMSDVLDEMLTKYLNRTYFPGSIFNYLRGNDDFGDPDNLDVCILNSDNVFKIIANEKKRHVNWFRRTKAEANRKDQKLIDMAMNFMRQSIYATRYNMGLTKRYRKKYSDDIRFNIAVFYGALMQLTLKMEAIFLIMTKMKRYTHFLWYLISYEKMLAAHVDVHDIVEKLFELHHKQRARLAGVHVEIAPTYPTTRTSTFNRSRFRGTRFRTTDMVIDENANKSIQYHKMNESQERFDTKVSGYDKG